MGIHIFKGNPRHLNNKCSQEQFFHKAILPYYLL